MRKIIVINGPNINILGKRELEIYGNLSYNDLVNELKSYANDKGANLDEFQSNSEGAIIDKLQELIDGGYDAVIINPAAYSHYSYAIYDALKAIKIKKVEVHLTNILARDEFRKNSVTAEACDGVISGFGFDSYKLAIDYLLREE
ncbi:type II 3-dehydroquinate dehydratase [Fenollaria massiliensis]|uniref:3-dehydroquinate dehydratase n=1 Tax=Fenollaria massiliensis TaxID=938288 RepID=A0A9E7DIV2_9FIRM|nr:type II 3-dehydroquinate dehydratase [Fenollaria massiliensis]UQK58745.1 type II 3-dehydroquinate dehydratase [Fenollaria massiliensis]